MAASIATRATGCALYVGVIIAAAWALSLASGEQSYATFTDLMGSPLGKLVLFGITVSLFYHLAAGIRHLVWDSGRGFQPHTANMTAMAAFAFGIVAALAVWAIAFSTGAA
jgi:succinate dehydrogenase / fumarate reductase cytochrome b subunit